MHARRRDNERHFNFYFSWFLFYVILTFSLFVSFFFFALSVSFQTIPFSFFPVRCQSMATVCSAFIIYRQQTSTIHSTLHQFLVNISYKQFKYDDYIRCVIASVRMRSKTNGLFPCLSHFSSFSFTFCMCLFVGHLRLVARYLRQTTKFNSSEHLSKPFWLVAPSLFQFYPYFHF